MKLRTVVMRIAIALSLLTGMSALGAGAKTVTAAGSQRHSSKLVDGGSLSIGTTEEPDTLNPYLTQLVTSYTVLSAVMEPMIDHDSKGHIFGRLATSYSISDDGLTYTWHLRHGVKFQNGAPFSARDVVATYHMIMNPKFGAYSTDGWNKITKISTPNKYTVVMKTKQLFAPFLVDVGGTAISPAGELAKGVKYFQQKFGRHPIGTGPYTFVKWVSGDHITMVRNPHYWGGTPHISTITLKIIPNDNTEMVQLKTGEIQMTDSLTPNRYAQVKSFSNVTPYVRPSLSWYHLDLKNIGFLADTKVRLALAYATPVQEIISRLMHGLALPCPTDQPPASLVFDPNIKLYPYDPKKALSLLTSDGFKKGSGGILEKGGKPLSIDYWIPSGDQLNVEVMQVVAASWKQVGIGVTTHTQDISTIWGANGYQFNKKLTAGGYSWFNNDDPDDRFYFNSSDIPKSPTGTGGDAPEYYQKYPWQKQIDKLTNEGAATVNLAKRKAIYWKVQQLLHKEEPLLFMYSVKLIYAAPKHMVGFDPSAYNFGQLWNVQKWQFTK